jgi:hypothetical protein
VIDVALGVDPYHAWTATRCLRRRRGLRRRRLFRGRSRYRTRSGSRHLPRCRRSWRCHGTRCSHRRRGCRRSLRRRRSFGRIPLLHPLVSPASPLLAGGGRIRSILALSGRSRRRLSHRHLRRQKPRRYRHPTNPCLHKRSPVRSLNCPARLRPNPTPSRNLCHSRSALPVPRSRDPTRSTAWNAGILAIVTQMRHKSNAFEGWLCKTLSSYSHPCRWR